MDVSVILKELCILIAAILPICSRGESIGATDFMQIYNIRGKCERFVVLFFVDYAVCHSFPESSWLKSSFEFQTLHS
jgi:hypothetical protein